MNSDTSNCKENNNAREGGAENDGNHHPPTPESCGTTLAIRKTTPTTTTTKDADNKKVYEDWITQNINKNAHDNDKVSKSQHYHECVIRNKIQENYSAVKGIHQTPRWHSN